MLLTKKVRRYYGSILIQNVPRALACFHIKAHVPKTWTELREGLREISPDRNPIFDLIYTEKCQHCGNRFEATSPRRSYCSEKCMEKAAAGRWYLHRLKRGDFKKAMAGKRENERRIVEARTAKQERREWVEVEAPLYMAAVVKAEALYMAAVYGKLSKETPYQYNEILRQLGGGDERRGHMEITSWHRERLKFEQISAEDQESFMNCAKKWGN